MRLVYLDCPINFGGAPQAMVFLARQLAERHSVHVLDAYGACEQFGQAIAAAGLPYEVLMPGARATFIGGRGLGRLQAAMRQGPAFWRLGRRVLRRVLELDPDVVLAWNAKALTFVATRWRLRRYPTALFDMSCGTSRFNGRWMRWLMRWRAGAVIAVSTVTHGHLLRAGVPPRKLHLGSMTVDMPHILEQAARGPAPVVPSGNKHPRILMLAARPEPAKGHVTAYRAVARLKRAGYDPALWLSGKPAAQHGDCYTRQLAALADELGIQENVFGLGWVENVPALVRACDVAILPSHAEGLPRSILEAMVLGCPVVATPVGGVPDCVQDGQTGLLIPVDDDAALADRIARLTQDLALRERLIASARQFVQAQFGPEQYVQRIERILHGLVRRPPHA